LLADGQTSEDDVAVKLLADLQAIFGDECADRLTTDTLLARLNAMTDRPWSEWRKGKPLSGASLARLLRPFRVQSAQIWIDGQNRHGYRLPDLADAFARYPPTHEVDQTARTLEPVSHKGLAGNSPTLEPDSASVPKNPRSISEINGSSALASSGPPLAREASSAGASVAHRTSGED
jgi:hypothetical protein